MAQKLLGAVAHDVSKTQRTLDVLLSENTSFADLMLSEKTLQGLNVNGFTHPSPIQLRAIPMGRLGMDLIIHAKSGTGKTLVFTIIGLEMLDTSISRTQILILAPTREIAVQIKEVISSIAVNIPGFKIAVFIGGLPIKKDIEVAKTCHVAVGTPGRLAELVKKGFLNLSSVRLFVLDEADRVTDDSFKKDVSFIFAQLPSSKQTLVVSATFPSDMELFLHKFLINPKRISPSSDKMLIGLRQFIAVIPTHTSVLVNVKNKTVILLQILATLPFRQCLVFSNMQSRMEGISKTLAKEGWPVLCLSSSMCQEDRLSTVSALQRQRCRVLISTDLAARGVDAEQVDLIVNLDLPYDTATFLHRIGRAGRFGSPGIAVTIVNDSKENQEMQNILFDVGGPQMKVPILPKELSPAVWSQDAKLEFIESLERTITDGSTSDKKIVLPENVPDQSIDFNSVNQSAPKKNDNYSREDAKVILSSIQINLPQSEPMPTLAELEESLKNFTADQSSCDDFLEVKEREVDEEVLAKAMDYLLLNDNDEENVDTNNLLQNIDNSINNLHIDDSCYYSHNGHTSEHEESEIAEEDELTAASQSTEWSDDDESYDNISNFEDYSSSNDEEFESTSSSTDYDEDDESSYSEDSDSDDVNDKSEGKCYFHSDKKCSTCKSWFHEWQKKLSEERQFLQQQLYMDEVSKLQCSYITK